MKTTIEQIDGKLYTVIHRAAESEFVCYTSKENGLCSVYKVMDYIALPALPRKPTEDDEPLLHRYMAEGIDLKTYMDNYERHWLVARSFMGMKFELTHATDKDGNRIDVAIDGSE